LPPVADDLEAIRERAVGLHRDLVTDALSRGRVDETQSADLRRFLRLLAAPSRLERRSRTFTIVAIASATLCVLLLSAVLRRNSVKTVVDLTVDRVNLDLASGRNSTAGLFARSRWIDLELLSASVPGTCSFHDDASHPGVGAHLRADTLDDAFPIGLGDATPIRDDTSVTYEQVDDKSLALDFGGEGTDAVDAALAVQRGTLTMLSHFAPSPSAAPCSLNGDEVDVRTGHVRFSPLESIGPVAIRGVDFTERRDVGARTIVASTIRSGVVSFETLPGAHQDLPRGTHLRLGPPADGGDLVAYINPDKDGLRVVIEGRLSVVDAGGNNLRPVLLEELWESPYLKVVAAAFASIFPVILWLAGRAGVKA
jgi:hypothetical protein